MCRWSRPAVELALALIVIAAFVPVSPALAQSAGCTRAQAIVAEVKEMYAAGAPDHRAVLDKLRIAHQLCPTFGEAWKYAYCSALAAGDERAARLFRDRALFNGIKELGCGETPGVAAAVPAKKSIPSYVRNKYALVIGVGAFRDPTIPRLQFAAKDARDFADTLLKSGPGNFVPQNVKVLLDEQATRAAILNALQDLFLRAAEDDLVVIYVSSHGSPAQTDKGLSGIGYIVTHDTTVKNIWVDAIEYQDFAQKTALINARRKVVFLDTCFSGQASDAGAKALSIEGIGIDERTARMFLSGEGTFVITSSKASERSWESDDLKNSYFTHFIIEAMNRSREPATIRTIFDYVAAKVRDAVARDKRAPQNPQIQPSSSAGDVKIGVLSTAVENP